jgi:hypothetical protein
MVIAQIMQPTEHTVKGIFMLSVSIPLLLLPLHKKGLIKGLVRWISFNSIFLIMTERMNFPLVNNVRICNTSWHKKFWELTRPDSSLEKYGKNIVSQRALEDLPCDFDIWEN